MWIEDLYANLPAFLQNAATNLQGWHIQRTRFGKGFRTQLDAYESRTFQTPKEVTALRNERLRRFITHSVNTVPYYRNLFRRLKLRAEDIHSLEDLSALPILTKQEVQQHYSELLSEAVPSQQRIITHTSGTTGGGLRFATTPEALQQQWAVWWRYRRWHGVEPTCWCGYFGGRTIVPPHQQKPPFWRINRPGKQILFSGYHMSKRNLGAYIAQLRRRQPPWLHGYPSLLALLAGYILETGDTPDYQPRWVTTGAENLLAQQANIIERAFGVWPRQHYGLAEAVANVSECENGRLHVDEDFSAVEFLPDPNGLGYRIIGTNFTNPATPLIRYDTQDVATPSDEQCSCGRPGRIVERIDGRQEDYIVLKNSARLGRMDHIFKDMTNIREAQLHQSKPGEINIRIVCGQNYTHRDEYSLLKEFQRRLGNETVLHIEHVSQLPRSKRGKLRFVVSEIQEARIVGALSSDDRN